MKLKYVVFDWDGTLADTYPVIAAAYDYTFDKMGLLRMPYDEIKRITSTLPNKNILDYVFKEHKNEAEGYFYEYIEKYHAEHLQPMMGANDLLESCCKAGLKCYLLTNKKTKFIKEELQKLGFDKYFTKIVAAGEYAEDKPHSIACHAVFGNRLPQATEIAVIGDGQADVRTAVAYSHDGKKATCIIFDPQNKYQGIKPDFKINKLTQAINILESIK